MDHLIRSCHQFRNLRGCHFYDETDCSFLPWDEVCKFVDTMPDSEGIDRFSEVLLETLANYDPSREHLAVKKEGTNVTLELYTMRNAF